MLSTPRPSASLLIYLLFGASLYIGPACIGRFVADATGATLEPVRFFIVRGHHLESTQMHTHNTKDHVESTSLIHLFAKNRDESVDIPTCAFQALAPTLVPADTTLLLRIP